MFSSVCISNINFTKIQAFWCVLAIPGQERREEGFLEFPMLCALLTSLASGLVRVSVSNSKTDSIGGVTLHGFLAVL